jgi:CubicO group peptidase (beta-lactamase class C family)
MRRLGTAVALLAGPVLASGRLPAQAPALDVDSSYAVVDGWIERGLRRSQIAGAALAIVRDGRIVHARGFGLADVARRRRVDPDTTVFHIASVTKLVTAIAALQQVEAGRLALQADVRPRLGRVRTPGWDRAPITLHQLLTHSAGFDTRWIGMAVARPTAVRPLAEYLGDGLPPIVDRPGSVVRYSNHGYAVVGRLVEVASGMSWGEYVEERIFAPLGMRASHARPRERSPSDAVPYRYRADTTPEPDIYEHTAPGGAVRATAVDVARLVAALLDSTSSVPLSPAGKALVLTPQGTIGAGVPGYAYGSFPYPNAHVPAMTVGGEVPGFSTRVLMVPRLGLGVVLVVNRKDPTLAIGVFDSLLARVRPASSDVQACRGVAVGGASVPAGTIAGAYRSNVYERGSFLRVAALLGPVLTIRADTGGRVLVVNPTDDSAGWWRRSGDSTWTGPGGECLAIVGGAAPMLAVSTKAAGPLMLERVTPLSSPTVVLPVAGLAIVVLVVALLAAGWRVLRHARGPASGDGIAARRIEVAVPAAHLAFLAAYGVGLYRLAIAYDDRFAFGIPAWFTATLVLPYVALALTIALAYALASTGVARDGGAPRRRWRGWLVVGASVVLLVVYWSIRAIWVA